MKWSCKKVREDYRNGIETKRISSFEIKRMMLFNNPDNELISIIIKNIIMRCIERNYNIILETRDTNIYIDIIKQLNLIPEVIELINSVSKDFEIDSLGNVKFKGKRNELE